MLFPLSNRSRLIELTGSDPVRLCKIFKWQKTIINKLKCILSWNTC